jgi:hypothetical protein
MQTFNANASDQITEPKYMTPEECKKQDGIPIIGNFGGPMCDLPTIDAGQFCNETNDCESRCMAIKYNPLNFIFPSMGWHFGICSKYKTRQAEDRCSSIVNKGRINSTYCDNE